MNSINNIGQESNFSIRPPRGFKILSPQTSERLSWKTAYAMILGINAKLVSSQLFLCGRAKLALLRIVYISVFSLYTLSLDFQEYNYSSWDLICLDVSKKAKWLQRSMLNMFLKVIYLHSVHPRFCWGVWVFYRIFKKVGLTGSQFLEGGCQKRGGDFCQQWGGVAVFT